MKRLTLLSLAALATFALLTLGAGAGAQAQQAGYRVGGFVDENNDGFNDLAPDADGDGIPNGLDPDYSPPLDGSGQRFGIGAGEEDPACAGGEEGLLHRLMHKWSYSWRLLLGGGETVEAAGWGPGDGTGYDGDGPGDGTGYGPGLPKKGYRSQIKGGN